MTSQRDQLQALIKRIDDLLKRTDSRSGVRLPEMGAERQVLAQTREYLSRLEQQMAGGQPFPQPDNGSALMAQNQQGWQAPAPQMAETAQQVLQAIVQEMSFLRTNMMQPLREEVIQLQQERHLLTTEIQRLQQERQQLAASPQLNQQKMIQEFLKTLMGRLQEQLAGQVAQAIANLEAQAAQTYSLTGGAAPQQIQGQSTALPRLSPAERLKHLQRLQAQSDDLLLRLDSTLRVVFESLQTNVTSYQDSLAQGLETMQSLGQPGETMFTALVNRLANQLGREASYYLKSPPPTEWELPGLASTDQGTDILLANSPADQAEQPPTSSVAASQNVQDEIPDDQVNRILGTAAPAPASSAPETAAPISHPLINDLLNDLDADLANLNQEDDLELDLGLDNLDLDAASIDLADELSDGDTPTPLADDPSPLPPAAAPQPPSIEVNDLFSELGELNELDAAPDVADVPADAAPPERMPGAVDAETDEALALLNQLATEMEDQLDESPWDKPGEETSDRPSEDNLSEMATQSDWDALDEPLYGDRPDLYAESSGLLNNEIDHAISDSFEDELEAELEAELETELEDKPAAAADEIDDFYAVFNAATGSDPLSSDDDIDSYDLDPDDLDSKEGHQEIDSEASLSNLFDETADETAEEEFFTASAGQPDWNQIGGSEEVETIQRLTDLVPDDPFPDSDMSTELSELAAGDRYTNGSADIYIQASPDEDLLSTTDTALTSADFQLDDTLMRQLSVDLSSLEGLEDVEDVEDTGLAEGPPTAAEEDWAAAAATLDAFSDELGPQISPDESAFAEQPSPEHVPDAPPEAEGSGADSSELSNGMTLDSFADRIWPPASILADETDASPAASAPANPSLEGTIESLFEDEGWKTLSQNEPGSASHSAAISQEDLGLDGLFQTDDGDDALSDPPATPARSPNRPTDDPETLTYPSAQLFADLFPTPSVPAEGEMGDRFDMTLDDFGMAADPWEEVPANPSPAADSDTGAGEETLTRESIAALFSDLPEEAPGAPSQGESPEQTLADLLRNPNASVPGRDRPPETIEFPSPEGLDRENDLDPFSLLFESRDVDTPSGEDTEKKN
ncbi:MAG: hypothetical protein VKK04_26890 [Synechococcales bacterium]|nr:hypothetical protein [Synechococcales bacterium]